MRMSKLFISVGMLLFFCIGNITAQQVIDTTKVIDLEEVIVTAQFVPQSEKNVVYKVKSISNKTILNKGASNLRELFQQELNIDLNQNSVFGTNIEIQGISKENIKILIDGVPVVGRLNGIIDLSQINLSNIERVEVIEGPVSVYYGTDAMGGVINLITKKTQKEKFEGVISASYEDVNAVNLNASLGVKFGNNTMRLNGGKYNFNGLSTNNAPRNLNWSERKQGFGGLTYIYQLEKTKIRYSGNLSDETLFSVGEPDRRGRIKDINYNTKRIDNSVNIQSKVASNKFLDITASYLDYERYHNAYDVNPITLESTISTTDIKENNIVNFTYGGVKAQLGKSEYSEKLNYAFGTDINVETTKGSRILEGKQKIQTIALFGSLNYKLTNNFEIQPAVRQTWNNTYGVLLSPAINSKIKLNKNSVLRFSYAQGFRAPSLKELFLDFHISAGPRTYIISGNENLKVEKSNSFNVQYSFKKKLDVYKWYSIEPSLFYNDISNLIALSEMVNNNRNYINIDRFKSVGGKIDIAFQPNKQLSLKTGVSIIGRYNKFTDNFNTDEFLYSPEISSNINYQVNNLGLGFNIFYKFTGERTGFIKEVGTNNLLKTTRKSFHNLDATILKSFFKKKIQVTTGVKNLLNVKDIVTVNEIGAAHTRDMQLWGRSFYIKTTIKF